MIPKLRILLLIIAVLTVLSGAVQMLAPGFVMVLVGGPFYPGTLHLFAIIGMFMILFGGLAIQGLRAPEAAQALPLRWAALQKIGAFIAVAMGILHGVFAPIAWLVASFDLVTGLLFFLYLHLLSGEE